MTLMASQISDNVFLFQELVQANYIGHIKDLLTGPLWGESTGDRWFPLQMASNAESVSIACYHNDDCIVVEPGR